MSPVWDEDTESDEQKDCDSCGEPAQIRIGQEYDYALPQCLECALELGRYLVASGCIKTGR